MLVGRQPARDAAGVGVGHHEAVAIGDDDLGLGVRRGQVGQQVVLSHPDGTDEHRLDGACLHGRDGDHHDGLVAHAIDQQRRNGRLPRGLHVPEIGAVAQIDLRVADP